MLQFLVITPLRLATLFLCIVISLYLYLYESQQASVVRSYLSVAPPSVLDTMFMELVENFQNTSQLYLNGLHKDTVSNCQAPSEYYEGSFTWLLGHSRFLFDSWWKQTTERYINDLVSNTDAAVITDVWLEDQRDQLYNRNSQLTSNFYETEIAAAAHRFQRPENSNEGAVDPSKITIIGASDVSSGNGLIQCRQAIEQREEYARYHGNKHIFYNMTRFKGDTTVEHAVWLKLPLVEETFKNDPNCEWVWWLDTDIVLTNGNFDLSLDLLNPASMNQRYLRSAPVPETLDRFGLRGLSPDSFKFEDIDFILSIDLFGINMGSVLIHRSEFSSEFLEVWSDPLQVYNKDRNSRHVRREQDAFARLWHDVGALRERTAFVGGPAINSYPTNTSTRWVVGDTLLHLAGRSGYSSFADEWNKGFEVYIKPGDPIPADYGWGTFPAANI